MQVNYYDGLTNEEKQKWAAEREHLWDVELPARLRADRMAAELEWTSRELVWSWIGGAMADFGGFQWFCLENPKTPCRRIVRFSLPDSGQVRVIHKFVHYHDYMGDRCEGEECFCRQSPTRAEHDYRLYRDGRPAELNEFHLTRDAWLLATATDDDGHLHRYRGTLQSTPPNEMDAAAVVFDRGTPQVVADHCARILELTSEPANFYALLDGANRCAFCHKPLRDQVSKLCAVGPDCAKKHAIPHTLEAASKRLALRKKLLEGRL
jgi:hypothetical protein